MTTPTPRSYIALALLFLSFSLLMASWYVKEKQSDYRSAIAVKMAEQETKLLSFAVLLDRDEADSVVNQVIKDCEIDERQRFDELLGSLSQLQRPALLELANLFDSCGSFYSDRQAILTIRFERELAIFKEYLGLMELTGTDTSEVAKKVSDWEAMFSLEKQRSSFSTQLVIIQEDIIKLLIAGESTQSENIQAKLAEAQEAKDSLMILNSQADTLREQLSNL